MAADDVRLYVNAQLDLNGVSYAGKAMNNVAWRCVWMGRGRDRRSLKNRKR